MPVPPNTDELAAQFGYDKEQSNTTTPIISLPPTDSHQAMADLLRATHVTGEMYLEAKAKYDAAKDALQDKKDMLQAVNLSPPGEEPKWEDLSPEAQQFFKVVVTGPYISPPAEGSGVSAEGEGQSIEGAGLSTRAAPMENSQLLEHLALMGSLIRVLNPSPGSTAAVAGQGVIPQKVQDARDVYLDVVHQSELSWKRPMSQDEKDTTIILVSGVMTRLDMNAPSKVSQAGKKEIAAFAVRKAFNRIGYGPDHGYDTYAEEEEKKNNTPKRSVRGVRMGSKKGATPEKRGEFMDLISNWASDVHGAFKTGTKALWDGIVDVGNGDRDEYRLCRVDTLDCKVVEPYGDDYKGTVDEDGHVWEAVRPGERRNWKIKPSPGLRKVTRDGRVEDVNDTVERDGVKEEKDLQIPPQKRGEVVLDKDEILEALYRDHQDKMLQTSFLQAQASATGPTATGSSLSSMEGSISGGIFWGLLFFAVAILFILGLPLLFWYSTRSGRKAKAEKSEMRDVERQSS